MVNLLCGSFCNAILNAKYNNVCNCGEFVFVFFLFFLASTDPLFLRFIFNFVAHSLVEFISWNYTRCM